MNIDVKSSFNKVLNSISELDGSEPIATKDLAGDIYSYIDSISLENAAERFDEFSKSYLDGKYKAEDFKDSAKSADSIMDKLSELNADKLMKSNNDITSELLSFYTQLGQQYLGDLKDRKDVDSSKIIEQLEQINSANKADSTNESAEGVTTAEAEIETTEEKPEEPEKTLEELLEELNSLVGLEEVKKEVEQIINIIKVQKKAEEFGEELPPLSLHLVFYGNPGTGKTTVARLLAKIYKCLGVLSKGNLVEVDRSGLVAGYVGQTATKTQAVIKSAMGGILFIDEAYSLSHGKGETDYGQEAIETLLKAMEDHRDDFIVIVAGYTELMKEFVESNPGLKSRFNQYIMFDDYTPEELLGIFNLQCKKNKIILQDGCDDFLKKYFEDMYNNRGEDYANGRDVRNYFENAIKAKANRIAPNIDKISHDELMTLTLDDLKEAASKKKDM